MVVLSPPCIKGTRIIYDRKFLLDCRNSPLARTPPCCLPQIPGVTVPATHSIGKLQDLKEEAEEEEKDLAGKQPSVTTHTCPLQVAPCTVTCYFSMCLDQGSPTSELIQRATCLIQISMINVIIISSGTYNSRRSSCHRRSTHLNIIAASKSTFKQYNVFVHLYIMLVTLGLDIQLLTLGCDLN